MKINNPNSFIAFNVPILRDYVNTLISIIDEHAQMSPDRKMFGMSYTEFRQDLFKSLDNIEHGSNRINATVSSLKKFSRQRTKANMKWVDLEQVVERALIITQGELKKHIKMVKKDIPTTCLKF